MKLVCDNLPVLHIVYNPIFHEKIKYIDNWNWLSFYIYADLWRHHYFICIGGWNDELVMSSICYITLSPEGPIKVGSYDLWYQYMICCLNFFFSLKILWHFKYIKVPLSHSKGDSLEWLYTCIVTAHQIINTTFDSNNKSGLK